MTTLRHVPRLRLAPPWWIGALLAAVLIGCGGGGDTSTAGNGVGVGGTGAAAGPVTGYGSLIVNNTRFDVDAASFADDDGTRLLITDAVRPVGLGAIVDIRSGAITRNTDNDDVAKATTVTVVSAIKGLVETAPSGNSLKVLGQTVNVNDATQYGTANAQLSDLTINMPVVVYGYQDGTGAYLATRIETISMPQVYKLRGRVTSVNTVNSRIFKMGEVTGTGGSLSGGIAVDTTGLTLVAPPTTGATVVVRLNTMPTAAGVYRAVQPLNTVDRTPVDASRSCLEGIVSGYLSGNASFKVDGVPVLTTSNTQVTGTLGNNRRVSVEGQVVNRVLVASAITVRADSGDGLASSYKLIGMVSLLNTSDHTFVLKNLLVKYDRARFDNGSEANLQNTTTVEVEGLPSSTGFVATRVRFR